MNLNWSIHHINLNAVHVAESVAFYRDLIGLDGGRTRDNLRGNPAKSKAEAYFFGDGISGLHIAKPDFAFATQHKLPINPTIGGHCALTVQDLAAVKRRLDAAGVVYSDPGNWGALPGMIQIYLYDPALNMIEINQVVSR